MSHLDRLCGLVVRVSGYRTEMYYASCEVRTEFIYIMKKKADRLCALVASVPGYRTEMYWVSCEVRTEFICYIEENRLLLWCSCQEFLATERRFIVSCEVRTEFMLCIRKQTASVTLITWTPYPQKLPLPSPTSGGHSVGIVRSRT
jgi:hypothetical protein